MIDTSPWLLLNAEDLELFPVPAADSPEARRLAILLCEARAGGVQLAAIARVLLDWASVLERYTSNAGAFETLADGSALLESVLADPSYGVAAVRAMAATIVETASDHSVAGVGALLARYADALATGRGAPDAFEVWSDATQILHAVFALAGPLAGSAIAECGFDARSRLF